MTIILEESTSVVTRNPNAQDTEAWFCELQSGSCNSLAIQAKATYYAFCLSITAAKTESLVFRLRLRDSYPQGIDTETDVARLAVRGGMASMR